MAGYVKVWTTIKSNHAFLSLSLLHRGAWYEILIAAKIQRDDGWVFYRNLAAVGMDWGCEGKTAGKILGNLQVKSLCTYAINDDGTVSIHIPNYKHWQDLDVKTLVANGRKKSGNFPPLRPDQTTPDHIPCGLQPQGVADLFNEICTALPKVKVMQVDSNRYKTTKRQITKHPDLKFWEQIFNTVQRSDFLTGRSGAWTGCGFDWIIKPANLIKIYEGNYGKLWVAPKTQQATAPKEPEMSEEDIKQADIARKAAVAAFKGGVPTKEMENT